MPAAFVTAFSIPPSTDTFAPTFQRLSTRFGNVMSSETSASSDSALVILLRALDFRVCHWQWTNLWTIIGDESSDFILLNPSWRLLRTSIFRDAFREKFLYSARSQTGSWTRYLKIIQRTLVLKNEPKFCTTHVVHCLACCQWVPLSTPHMRYG